MSDKLLSRITELLEPYPEAREFVLLYNQYAHAIDDLIDEPARKDDKEFILKVAHLANETFSCSFYRRHAPVLQPIEFMVNNTYADSVLWEKSEEPWKREAAASLRHAGIDLFFATVSICCGRDKMREISAEMREYTFRKHLHDNKTS